MPVLARRASALKGFSPAPAGRYLKTPYWKSAGLFDSALLPDAGERSFAYAKACGILAKSFIGKKISELGKLDSLTELNRLIFPEVLHELPEREMIVDLESRITQRATRHILAVFNAYTSPPELLVRQLRSCEYADLKTCLHYISSGKVTPPILSNIGRYRTVRFKAYPDLAAMLAGTEFSFIRAKNIKAIKSPDFDLTSLETELDLRYYALLVQSICYLSADDRFIAQRILADEISLRNCVWALRLRTYFKKSPDAATKYLMDLKMPAGMDGDEVLPGSIHPRSAVSGGETSLASEARKSLRFPLDSRSAWKDWRWESLLNPEMPGKSWAADPRYFQNAASQYIYRLSLRSFRLMPFSVSSIFCYVKLKQFEEDLLTSIVEGLGLGMAARDVFTLLEASV